METKEKPKPTPDYLMQLMNDKKLMSSLPNFCGIFNHLERLLDEGNARQIPRNGAGNGARSFALKAKRLTVTIYSLSCIFGGIPVLPNTPLTQPFSSALKAA